jgi:hypothetical protein
MQLSHDNFNLGTNLINILQIGDHFETLATYITASDKSIQLKPFATVS